jgi:hypothetical protein
MDAIPNSIVQRRLEDFERQQKEISQKSDLMNFKRVRWHGRSHGRFSKVVNDSRGVPPKRSLSDLP